MQRIFFLPSIFSDPVLFLKIMRGYPAGVFMMANDSSVFNHSIFKSLSFIFIFVFYIYFPYNLLLFYVHLLVLFLMPFALNVHKINIFVWMCTCVETREFMNPLSVRRWWILVFPRWFIRLFFFSCAVQTFQSTEYYRI